MSHKKVLIKQVTNVVEGLDLIADLFDSELRPEDKVTLTKVLLMFSILEGEVSQLKDEDIPPAMQEKLKKYIEATESEDT